MEIKKLKRVELKERFGIEFNNDYYRLAICQITNTVNSVGPDIILEELLIEWDNFVNDLKDGYNMSAYEFDNDIDSYRGSIEHLVSSKYLEKFEEHDRLKLIVSTIDEKYKEITIEIKELSTRGPWWNRRILQKADAEYFDTLGLDLSSYEIVRT